MESSTRAGRVAGVVDTPAALADRVARPAVGPGSEVGILDPACGEGELLLAAWRAAGKDPAIARRLAGIEIDPERARRAGDRLRAAIGGRAGAAAARGIRVADALLDDAWPRGAAVVANPPWVSLSGPRRARLEPARVAGYRARYASLAGWPSLHGAFLERIALHVASERTHAHVLVPSSVGDGARYAALRAEVDARVRCDLVFRLPQGAFDGVVEATSLLALRPHAGARRPGAWSAAREAPADDALERMASFPPLPPECYADVGVHTGNAAAVLLLAPDARGGAPLRQGRDLSAHRLAPASARLAVPPPREAGLRFRVPPLERLARVPVLLRQTADRPIAALHREPGYFRNTLLACTPPRGLAPEAAVAILNAAASARWHRARFPEARQAAFPQVKIGHLRALPFPLRERRESPALHDELAELGRALATLEGPARTAAAADADRAVARAFGL